MSTHSKYINSFWSPTTLRFVVFLDIMGFKDLVSRNTHDFVYNLMAKLSSSKEVIDNAFNEADMEDTPYKNKKLLTTSFSDSIILFSKDDTFESFEIISASASFIFAEAITDHIPMKGSIAHGEISINKEEQIYFGQPLIDAYLLQEEVNFYGIVSHNTIDAYLSELTDAQIKENNYIDIKTPLKSGDISHYNIKWFESLADIKDPNRSNREIFEAAMKAIKSQTSGSPRKYIDNTIDFYNKLYPISKKQLPLL